VAELPANQQKRRRRSSVIPPLNFNNPEDETLSSTVYSSDSEQADDVAEIQGEEMSDSGSDIEDGTMMTVEADEMTSASVASVRSTGSDSTSLEENLRLAARQAVTQQLDDDEEEIPAFSGWIKKDNASEGTTSKAQATTPRRIDQSPERDVEDGTEMEMDVDMDMDMTSAVGRIINPQNTSPQQGQIEDMSMDITRAYGGIVPQQQPQEGSFGEETMDLTTAVGGIQHGRFSDGSQADPDGNEDMSMELTTAIGGFLSKSPKTSPAKNRRRTITARNNNNDNSGDSTMDITMAVGRIISTVGNKDEEGDVTIGMDMTMPLGGIIKNSSSKPAADKVTEEAANKSKSSTTKTPKKASPSKENVTEQTASPGLAAFRGKGLRRTPARDTATAPKDSKSEADNTSKVQTPSKNLNTEVQTPPSRRSPEMIGSRSNSPKRPASPNRVATTPQSVSKSKAKESSVFRQDPATGATTPRVVLTPQRRRLSGVGIDRSGLGSPRVAKIFERRDSIGNSAQAFMPSHSDEGRRIVKFADPRTMSGEIDRERQEEEDRENGRKILEREADGSQDERDATLNLKEMIQGLSPKKNPLKGRKSLHVGSAKGLLGKRPAELEEDEDTDEQDGVKRLKGHQGSPVKNVKLRSPPSKAETTGRMTRASKKTLDLTKVDLHTPTGTQVLDSATTPKSQGRFKNVEDDPSTIVQFDQNRPIDDVEMAGNDDDDRIHLQDFLNMTSIRFMELTTTKRRHTVAPTTPKGNLPGGDEDDMTLEKCVVAGACTVPMLELYQHVSPLSLPRHPSKRS
jgi:kinetochore protein Spc7/SPC105